MKPHGFFRLRGLVLVSAVMCGCAVTAERGNDTHDFDTLFLTWFNDPTSTITVQWLAREPAEPVRVACYSALAERPDVSVMTTVTPFGDSPYRVHRATLRKLRPYTDYQLAIDGGPARLPFRTAPAALTEPLIFAEGGDVGTSEYVALLHSQAAAWQPMFGLVGGDIAYANGTNHRRWLKYLRLWRRHMVTPDGRLIPMICVIGNHEVRGGFNGSRDDAPFFYALFDGLYPSAGYATLDFGDYLSLILLDSQHTTPVAGEQTLWLERELARRRDVPHVLAAYHVPAYPAHSPFHEKRGNRPGIRELWTPLFEEYQVDAVFEHDEHVYKRTHRLQSGRVVGAGEGGILYLGDGAWGKGPRRVHPNRAYLAAAESKRHVIRVMLHPDGTQAFLAVDPAGNVIDRYPGD